jgi:hypothetical protein
MHEPSATTTALGEDTFIIKTSNLWAYVVYAGAISTIANAVFVPASLSMTLILMAAISYPVAKGWCSRALSYCAAALAVFVRFNRAVPYYMYYSLCFSIIASVTIYIAVTVFLAFLHKCITDQPLMMVGKQEHGDDNNLEPSYVWTTLIYAGAISAIVNAIFVPESLSVTLIIIAVFAYKYQPDGGWRRGVALSCCAIALAGYVWCYPVAPYWVRSRPAAHAAEVGLIPGTIILMGVSLGHLRRFLIWLQCIVCHCGRAMNRAGQTGQAVPALTATPPTGDASKLTSEPRKAESALRELGLEAEAFITGVSSRLERLETMTTCGVCMEGYASEPPPHAPRSLGCGHTFCTGCVATMLVALPRQGKGHKGHKTLACPTCREETKVRRGRAESLQKNFALIA